MKKHVLLIAFLFVTFFNKAQIQDLASLSSGENVYFSFINNSDEELYGYFALFYKGKATDETRNFEYVILDTNLNRVANKDFEAENTVMYYYPYINFKKELVLVPEFDMGDYNIFNYGKMKAPKRRVINLTTNEIKAEDSLCYDEDGTFIECPESLQLKEMRKQYKQNKKDDKPTHDSDVYELEEGGYMVYEDLADVSFYYGKSTIYYYGFKRFDEDKNLQWEYTYNRPKDAHRKENKWAAVLHMSKNNLYLIEKHKYKKDETYTLVQLDLATGDVKLKKKFDEQQSAMVNSLIELSSLNRRIDNEKSYDENIYMIGYQYDKKENRIGYTRLTIDETNNTLAFDNLAWEDMEEFIDINKYGRVEKGYSLFIRDLYIMEDGKIGMLFEKFKFGSNFFTGATVPKATDMVYVTTDKDFKVRDVRTLKKDKSKRNLSDYMYSQYLNDNKDVVFFYRNFQKDEATKEKNWNLFINTVIDGNYNQEVVPISSEENMILPYVAKEGYILLREFNKDRKYNQIRLEKLNF